MSTWNEEEDGMGFAGLLPSRAEREREKALSAAHAEGRKEGREATVAEFAGLLPGPHYMDPPDGGSVSVLEQVQRMAEDAKKWREQAERITLAIKCEIGLEG